MKELELQRLSEAGGGSRCEQALAIADLVFQAARAGQVEWAVSETFDEWAYAECLLESVGL